MAASPEYKIYNADGKYQGCMKHVEDAAIIIGVWQSGQIRWQHSVVVWSERDESQSAAESYDFVADIVAKRIHRHNVKAYMAMHPGEKLPSRLH